MTTLDYYNTNAQAFFDSTANVDFAAVQDRFLALLPPAASILDFGCGSGRDAKRFRELGYTVEAVDGSEELCRIASEHAGVPVRNMLFSELEAAERYDGIWACSSILHVPKAELPDVLDRIRRALKPSGILYTSFKHSEFEGIRNGRYFSDFTEGSFRQLLAQVPGLEIEQLWVTGDVRPGRGGEQWLNLIIRKS